MKGAFGHGGVAIAAAVATSGGNPRPCPRVQRPAPVRARAGVGGDGTAIDAAWRTGQVLPGGQLQRARDLAHHRVLGAT